MRTYWTAIKGAVYCSGKGLAGGQQIPVRRFRKTPWHPLNCGQKRMLSTILEVEEEDDEVVILPPRDEVDLDVSWNVDTPAELSPPLLVSSPLPWLPDDPLDLLALKQLPLSWHWRSDEAPHICGISESSSSVESSVSYISDWQRPLHDITMGSMDDEWCVEHDNNLVSGPGEQPQRCSPAGSFVSDFEDIESSLETVGDSELCFVRLSCAPSYVKLPEVFGPICLSSVWKTMPPTLKTIYTGKSQFTLLRQHSSVSCKRLLSASDNKVICEFVNDMLEHNLIMPVKHCSFVSYPFVIPKGGGSTHIIIDYGHLKAANLYNSPKFSLPPVLSLEPIRIKLSCCSWFCKIDLRSAFYAVPLPRTLQKASTFAFNNARFQFKVLPMGIFLVPYILQTILKSLLGWYLFCVWIHLDDLLIYAHSFEEIVRWRGIIVKLLREAGFIINTNKSVLRPTNTISYCGLRISGSTFDLASDKLLVVKKLLFEQSHCGSFWKAFGHYRNTKCQFQQVQGFLPISWWQWASQQDG